MVKKIYKKFKKHFLNKGTVFEPSYIVKNKDLIEQKPYKLIIKNDENDLVSQVQFFSQIDEIFEFSEFKSKLLCNSQNPKFLFIFSLFSRTQIEFLKKVDELLFSNEQIQAYYLRIVSSRDFNNYVSHFRLSPPLFACFISQEKILEFSLNNKEILKSIEGLIDKLNHMHENEINNDISTQSEDVSECYLIDEYKSFNTYNIENEQSSCSIYELKDYSSLNQSVSVYNIDEDSSRKNQQIEQKSNDIYSKPFQTNCIQDLNQKNNENLPHPARPIEKSYFLSDKKLTNTNASNYKFQKKLKEKPKSSFMKAEKEESISNKAIKKNSKYTDFYTFLNKNESDLEPEEFGMSIHLFKEKDPELLELLNDLREIPNNEINILLIKSLSKKRFALWLIENANKETINRIESEKRNQESKIYTALQCFKYDSDLPDLKSSIERGFTFEKIERDEIFKQADAFLNNVLLKSKADFQKKDEDFISNEKTPEKKNENPDSQQKLATIKEKSAKEEDTPSFLIPLKMNCPDGVNEKGVTKYAEMVTAISNNSNKNSEKKGINLVSLDSSGKKKMSPKRDDLKIHCENYEHPLAREVIERFFQKDEIAKYVRMLYYYITLLTCNTYYLNLLIIFLKKNK